MSILDQPVRVDREGERLYFYAPGEVCVDICSGRPDDRKRVMALLEQAQEVAGILLELHGSLGGHNDSEWHTHDCWRQKQVDGKAPCTTRCVKSARALRDARVLR